MPYGPDNSKEMNFTWVHAVQVPQGGRIVIDFSSQAAWENAICIYQLHTGDDKIAERGNHGRSLSRWVSEPNQGLATVTYLISGWHKNTPPNAGAPWHQSRGKIVLQTGSDVVFGFEDAGDNDYNDIVAFVRRNPSHL